MKLWHYGIVASALIAVIGCQGPTGPAGEQGIQGEPGTDGSSLQWSTFTGTLDSVDMLEYSGAYGHWDIDFPSSDSTIIDVYVRDDSTDAWMTPDYFMDESGIRIFRYLSIIAYPNGVAPGDSLHPAELIYDVIGWEYKIIKYF